MNKGACDRSDCYRLLCDHCAAEKLAEALAEIEQGRRPTVWYDPLYVRPSLTADAPQRSSPVVSGAGKPSRAQYYARKADQ